MRATLRRPAGISNKLSIVALLGLLSCDAGQLAGPVLARARLRSGTPHEQYAASLEDAGLAQTALGRDWLSAAESSLAQAGEAQLPYREVGYFPANQASARAYRVALRRGQRFRVHVALDAAAPGRLFVDVFQQADGSRQHIASLAPGAEELTFEPAGDGTYLVRFQPELLRGGRYSVDLSVEPLAQFPVQGHGIDSLKSPFGASRDGGRRRHEGVDLFAPRGTLVLSAMDGFVTRVKEGGLGGKVVWVSDSVRGIGLYYAHLDTQLVAPGSQVHVGDVLGTVGNTGNARTTPSHLHFGVYASRGVLDPFPFLDPARAAAEPAGDPLLVGQTARAFGRSVALRSAASPGALVLRYLPRNASVEVRGATAQSYRVRTPDGLEGFVATGQLRAGTTVAAVALDGERVVRETPSLAAIEVDTLPAGARVEVDGEYDRFLHVRLADGRQGWLEPSI